MSHIYSNVLMQLEQHDLLIIHLFLNAVVSLLTFIHSDLLLF